MASNIGQCFYRFKEGNVGSEHLDCKGEQKSLEESKQQYQTKQQIKVLFYSLSIKLSDIYLLHT